MSLDNKRWATGYFSSVQLKSLSFSLYPNNFCLNLNCLLHAMITRMFTMNKAIQNIIIEFGRFESREIHSVKISKLLAPSISVPNPIYNNNNLMDCKFYKFHFMLQCECQYFCLTVFRCLHSLCSHSRLKLIFASLSLHFVDVAACVVPTLWWGRKENKKKETSKSTKSIM